MNPPTFMGPASAGRSKAPGYKSPEGDRYKAPEGGPTIAWDARSTKGAR